MLIKLTLLVADQCNAAYIALGLNLPPANVDVAARRQILMDYLGAGMRA